MLSLHKDFIKGNIRLLYDKFADFETVQSTLLLGKFDITYVVFNSTVNKSVTKLNMKADILLRDVDPEIVYLFFHAW